MGGVIHPIVVDYHDTRGLAQALLAARQSFGPFKLGLVWVHSTAPEAPAVIAGALADPARPCPYFHVLGSGSSDPSGFEAKWRAELGCYPGIEYHSVILGFVRTPTGSRWLTHKEISAGVLQAIDQRAPSSIVGIVSPWSERP